MAKLNTGCVSTCTQYTMPLTFFIQLNRKGIKMNPFIFAILELRITCATLAGRGFSGVEGMLVLCSLSLACEVSFLTLSPGKS